jgi:hypothetical protein
LEEPRVLELAVAKVEVYDKAKWHYDADNFGRDLAPEQGFVHTGLFLGWLVVHDLVDPVELADEAPEIDEVRRRGRTGPELFQWIDGTLLSTMLTDEGNRFAAAYLDFDHGGYLRDYEAVLGVGLPSLYHVADTWQNYDRLAKVIDRRYAAWQAAGRPPVWRPRLTLGERLSLTWRRLSTRKQLPGPDLPIDDDLL